MAVPVSIIQLASGVKTFLESFDHELDLVAPDFRIHGKGEKLLRAAFGDWKRTRLETQEAIGLLQVNGNRVMDATPHSARRHSFHHSIPVGHTYGVDMVNVGAFGML